MAISPRVNIRFAHRYHIMISLRKPIGRLRPWLQKIFSNRFISYGKTWGAIRNPLLGHSPIGQLGKRAMGYGAVGWLDNPNPTSITNLLPIHYQPLLPSTTTYCHTQSITIYYSISIIFLLHYYNNML